MATPEEKKFTRRQLLLGTGALGLTGALSALGLSRLFGRSSQAEPPKPQDIAAASGPVPKPDGDTPTIGPTIAPSETPTIVPATATVRPIDTATSTATNTPEPSPTPKPEPTKTPTLKPVPSPTAAPTSVPTEQPTPVPPTPEPPPPPKIEPKPEAPSAAFPKEIGNLERDNIAIHNKGNQYGMVARDFAYLSQMAKKYGVKVEVFLYDRHADNPYAQDIPDDQAGKGKAVVHRNPNGWVIPYGQGTSLRGENGTIQIHLSFNANFKQIISGQIFPGDQYAQFRKEEIERGNSSTVATILRFRAPSSEWPKTFGPAPEDLLKLGKPLPNLQLAISQ